MSMVDGIRIVCRGDGNQYQFHIKHNDFDNVSFYFANFNTSKEWSTIEIPWNQFHMNHKARDIGAAQPINFQVTQYGVGIEKPVENNQKFWLEIDRFELYAGNKTLASIRKNSTSKSDNTTSSTSKDEQIVKM